MKKIVLFFPMVILLFMFLPNYKTDAAVIICPFVVGIDPGCDTNPTGDINIPVGSYN